MPTTELELAQNQDDVIVSGSTWAAIWHMSWPSLLQMLTISLASFADVWVAGHLGSEVQATIGLGGQIWFFMTLLAVALSAGTTALVSRFWGAKDYAGAIEASRQSLFFAGLFGIFSCIASLSIARGFYAILGATPHVQALGWEYLKFDLLSQVPFTILWVAHSIFRAKGNPRLPCLVWAILTVLIIVLDIVLCLHPFHLGVAGIGLSWLIAGIVGATLDIILLKRSDISECVNFRPILRNGMSKEWFVRLFHIGIPACVQDLAWVGGNFILFKIFSQTADPTSCQASWAVGLRLEEMVAGMPIYAMSMSISTIVGQNLGAKRPDRASRAGWQCATMGGAYNAIVGALLFIFALPIAQIMSHDPKVTEYTRQYLQIVGCCEPFVALWLILFGAMQGAGYTKWPMYITTLCLVLFRMPLAWYLTVPMNMAPSGCWYALSISATVLGLLAAWRFNTGVWQQQKV